MTITQGAHSKFVGNSPISSLSLLVKSIEEEIQAFNNPVNEHYVAYKPSTLPCILFMFIKIYLFINIFV